MNIKDFKLTLSELQTVGQNLERPESIIAERDGTLWISDARGIVTRMDRDGSQTLLGNVGHQPNGLAMDTQGNLYNANIGDGKVYKLYPDGSCEVILDSIDGMPLGAPNFVFIDSQDRLWISFSTRQSNWFNAITPPQADGYIVLIDNHGARVVAQGLYFTNEIRLNAEESHLYVAETTKSRILRFAVDKDGNLDQKEVFGPDSLGFAAYVDGISFDIQGNLWVTTVFRNGLMIIDPEGEAHTVFEDPVEDALNNTVKKLDNGSLTPEDMSACMGANVQFPTSITFAGADLKTVYIGSLAMPHLLKFQSPVAGLPMRHWR